MTCPRPHGDWGSAAAPRCTAPPVVPGQLLHTHLLPASLFISGELRPRLVFALLGLSELYSAHCEFSRNG